MLSSPSLTNPSKGVISTGVRPIAQLEVTFIPQLHFHQGLVGNEPALIETGLNQLSVYRELERLGAKHIFYEGQGSGAPIVPFSRGRAETLFAAQWTPVLGEEALPKELSNEQLKYLARIGAVYAYALHHPDVTIWPVSNKDRAAECALSMVRGESSEERIRQTVYVERETETLRSISNNLSKIAAAPGATAIVFGYLHKFDDAISKNSDTSATIAIRRAPIDIPQTASQSTWEIRSTRDISQQQALLNSSRNVYQDAYPALVNESLQLIALDKLYINPRDIPSPESARDYLIAMTKNSALGELVKDEIQRRYEQQKAPFSHLFGTSLNVSEREVKAMTPTQINELLIRETNAMNQNAILQMAEAIPPLALRNIISNHARLVALDHVVVDTGNYPGRSPQELLGFLISVNLPGPIQTRLIAEAQSSRGIFAAYQS